jgi:hypothetical protein
LSAWLKQEVIVVLKNDLDWQKHHTRFAVPCKIFFKSPEA